MDLKKKVLTIWDKFIRVITVVPVIAFITISLLYFESDKVFVDYTHYIVALITLCIIPILAYPMQKIIPVIKDKGREGQRNLAFVFAFVGYVIGIIFAYVALGAGFEKIIYLTYAISFVIIAIVNFVFKYKASAHACGISAPIVMLGYCINWHYLIAFILVISVGVSSVRLKRHTIMQYVIGALISVGTLLVLIALL